MRVIITTDDDTGERTFVYHYNNGISIEIDDDLIRRFVLELLDSRDDQVP